MLDAAHRFGVSTYGVEVCQHVWISSLTIGSVVERGISTTTQWTTLGTIIKILLIKLLIFCYYRNYVHGGFKFFNAPEHSIRYLLVLK